MLAATTLQTEVTHPTFLTLHSLFSGYDRDFSPCTASGPLVIDVSMDVMELAWKGNKMHILYFLREKWVDERLQSNTTIPIKIKESEKAWLPDVFSPTAIQSKTEHDGALTILPHGELVLSRLIKSSFNCPLSLTSVYLKNGTVNCTVTFEPYGHSENEVKLRWADHGVNMEYIKNKNCNYATVIESEENVVSAHGRKYSRLEVVIEVQTGITRSVLEYQLQKIVSEL
ncbi:unnamed protein product [Soboliphyme baturini]|uniref:Neur_chan_LBD domain-containing protein n=1 Tax=Soboliphyme baturini TaxID=241478 RepID=A0A183IIS8_9BILA|nr:unnamed protein product [Soboliphyme baturini]